MNLKFVLFGAAILGCACYQVVRMNTTETVNICAWYGIFPPDVLQQFEQESGIKVILDTFENNDVLEAKIISGNSKYDIVTPSFIPYASRQVSIGAYDKIKYKYIPNIRELQSSITEKFKSNGGNTQYLIPYFWGTIGIVYNYNRIKKFMPGVEHPITYEYLFGVSKLLCGLSKHGIAFPEEYTDIFPQLHGHCDTDDLNVIKEHISGINKYVTKFNSSTTIYDIVSGNLCLAICSSDIAYKIKRESKNKIIYSIPKNQTPMWVDCLAIPRKASHKKNAYKFINFILQPKIAAKISNYSGILTNVKKSFAYLDKSITNDETICPTDDNTIKSFIMGRAIISAQDQEYDRQATKIWAEIKYA